MKKNSPAFNLRENNFSFGYYITGVNFTPNEDGTLNFDVEDVDLSNLITMETEVESIINSTYTAKHYGQKRCNGN